MSFQAFPDNQQLTKHVESTSVSCLDAGSTPASSTWKGVKLPRNTKKDTDNLFDYQCLSLFCTVLLSGLPACPNLGALVLCGRQGVRLPQCDSPTAENGNMMHDSGYVGLSYQGSRIVSRQPKINNIPMGCGIQNNHNSHINYSAKYFVFGFIQYLCGKLNVNAVQFATAEIATRNMARLQWSRIFYHDMHQIP